MYVIWDTTRIPEIRYFPLQFQKITLTYEIFYIKTKGSIFAKFAIGKFEIVKTKHHTVARRDISRSFRWPVLHLAWPEPRRGDYGKGFRPGLPHPWSMLLLRSKLSPWSIKISETLNVLAIVCPLFLYEVFTQRQVADITYLNSNHSVTFIWQTLANLHLKKSNAL